MEKFRRNFDRNFKDILSKILGSFKDNLRQTIANFLRKSTRNIEVI